MRREDPEAFAAVVEALILLARRGPPSRARRFPVDVPAAGKPVDVILFGFDVAGVRVLFEGERLVMRSAEGWDLVRGLPRPGQEAAYTVWAIVRLTDADGRGGP